MAYFRRNRLLKKANVETVGKGVAGGGGRARVGARGCRRDGGGRGSCLRRSGGGSTTGGPACSALCSHVRPMLLGAGLYGAGRARATAGAATCAGPGRAVAGGVRWDVRGACAGEVGARPRRGLRCRVSEGRGGSGYPGRRKQGRWAYA